MITKSMVETGIARGVIKFIPDPAMYEPEFPDALTGTAAQIGNRWFYFGGTTAEDTSPKDIMRVYRMDELVEEVFHALDCFDDDYNRDEYDYYEAYLHERCDVSYTILEASEPNSTPLEFTDPNNFMAVLRSKMAEKVNSGENHFDIQIL